MFERLVCPSAKGNPPPPCSRESLFSELASNAVAFLELFFLYLLFLTFCCKGCRKIGKIHGKRFRHVTVTQDKAGQEGFNLPSLIFLIDVDCERRDIVLLCVSG